MTPGARRMFMCVHAAQAPSSQHILTHICKHMCEFTEARHRLLSSFYLLPGYTSQPKSKAPRGSRCRRRLQVCRFACFHRGAVISWVWKHLLEPTVNIPISISSRHVFDCLFNSCQTQFRQQSTDKEEDKPWNHAPMMIKGIALSSFITKRLEQIEGECSVVSFLSLHDFCLVSLPFRCYSSHYSLRWWVSIYPGFICTSTFVTLVWKKQASTRKHACLEFFTWDENWVRCLDLYSCSDLLL